VNERAQLVRELVASRKFGTLATHSARHEGFPFASIVEYGLDEAGQPVFLLSGLAVHSKNLALNPKASLLVFANETEQDTLGSARVTLMGEVRPVPKEETGAIRQSYLYRHPGSAQWVEFGDFRFYRLHVTDVYYVGGFGAMGWVSVQDYRG
jgi:heme iron utilization protein